MTWQPIETARTDGTRYIVYHPEYADWRNDPRYKYPVIEWIGEAYVEEKYKMWVWMDGSLCDQEPTAWWDFGDGKELPAPPEANP
jgi:hypothetical protein